MSDRDCPNLFVYGTLRSSFRNEFARLLSEKGSLWGKGRIRGRLYRFRGYPGAIVSSAPGDWVAGEIYQLHDPAATLAALDQYEGCGPGDLRPHEFRRILVNTLLDDGRERRSWVYVCNWPGSEEQRIHSGDFLESR